MTSTSIPGLSLSSASPLQHNWPPIVTLGSRLIWHCKSNNTGKKGIQVHKSLYWLHPGLHKIENLSSRNKIKSIYQAWFTWLVSDFKLQDWNKAPLENFQYGNSTLLSFPSAEIQVGAWFSLSTSRILFLGSFATTFCLNCAKFYVKAWHSDAYILYFTTCNYVLRGLFHLAFLARVCLFVGLCLWQQRQTKRWHVQSMLDETDPLMSFYLVSLHVYVRRCVCEVKSIHFYQLEVKAALIRIATFVA